MAIVEARQKQKVALQSYFKKDLSEEMINFYVRKTNTEVPITKRAAGYYMFGTQQIFTKMHEGKLLVKTAKGYLTFPEFLQIQGPIETERARYVAPELMQELHSQATLSSQFLHGSIQTSE